MNKKDRTPPITEDKSLPRDLTDRFISDLLAVVKTDEQIRAPYLAEQLLSKFAEPSADEASNRRRRAIEKWLATESRNTQTNHRINTWCASESVMVLPGISAKKFFSKVRSIVNTVLPWTPSLDIRYGGFSGGASTSKSRRHSHPAVKFRDKADVTRPAQALFNDVSRQSRWADHIRTDPGLEPRIVAGNVMFTVPKNSDIDRCACKEPDLNMFLQKMFGQQIRSCLKKVGIDLNDQTRNQELARIGAETGSLMTLDLSSASDSVTTSLVRECVPFDWFWYMDLVRSHVTEIDGEAHVNEMFSSMGNGFTFELESLLFYSITRAVAYFGGVRGTISVYGDDIIAPAELFDALCSALAFCGFVPNADKSFAEGPFRESCGKHWHGSVDVSPFYIRGPFQTLSDLILTLNQLTSWASRDIGVVDPRYEVVIRRYMKYVPPELWGGADLTSRTSLVTGDSPRFELVYPVRDMNVRHIGGLILWLFQTLNRVEEGCLRVSRVTGPTFAVMRRRRVPDRLAEAVDGDVPVFLGFQDDTENVADRMQNAFAA